MTTTLLIPVLLATAVQISGVAGMGRCDHVAGVNASAWYNWTPVGGECEGAQFIPEIRDARQVELLRNGTLQLEINKAPFVLGFNEPNLSSQANLTPAQAVPLERWRLTTYTDTRHASPAPSMEAIEWLPEMRDLYIAEYGEPPAWDYLAAHCYFWDLRSLIKCKAVVRQYIAWANDWGADGVVVSEFGSFAFRGTPGDPFDYAPALERAREFVAWMREQPEIVGWFWYSAHDWGVWPWYATTALYDDSERLTPLGDWYNEENSNNNYRPDCVHSRGRFDRREVRECQM